MTRSSHIVIAAYAFLAGWLSFCTITTLDRVPEWFTVTMGAASVAPILGIIRELDLRDARRHAAGLIAWRTQEHEARNGKPLSQLEEFMWVGLAEQLAEPDDQGSSAA